MKLIVFRRFLYCAILDKSNAAAAPAGEGKKGGQGGAVNAKNNPLRNTKAKVLRVDTSEPFVDDLGSRFYWFKHEVMQFLLKMEYQRSMFAQRERMLANLDDKERSEETLVSILINISLRLLSLRATECLANPCY